MNTRFNVRLRSKIISYFIREFKMDKETAVKAFNNYKEWQNYAGEWYESDKWRYGLEGAFLWSNTPEGGEFWRNVDKNSRK